MLWRSHEELTRPWTIWSWKNTGNVHTGRLTIASAGGATVARHSVRLILQLDRKYNGWRPPVHHKWARTIWFTEACRLRMNLVGNVHWLLTKTELSTFIQWNSRNIFHVCRLHLHRVHHVSRCIAHDIIVWHATAGRRLWDASWVLSLDVYTRSLWTFSFSATRVITVRNSVYHSAR